mmetsp:Transcript_10071/g.16984  ORF Transcript_10071/g.16984 Transcript_10071/m.16984 type:complete len:152 (-) Transcript_10071:35-490(-)
MLNKYDNSFMNSGRPPSDVPVSSRDKLVYIPQAGDDIDYALSVYINQKLEFDGMTVVFVRMSEGVYKFGTKIVYLSCDFMNNLQVRVSGKVMDIEDFVNQFQMIEGEKMQKKPNLKSRLQLKLRQRSNSNNSRYGLSPRSNSSMLRSSIKI